jgi:hypothetical protein
MSKVWNSGKIHWRIGQRKLWNVQAKSSQKGCRKYLINNNTNLNVNFRAIG